MTDAGHHQTEETVPFRLKQEAGEKTCVCGTTMSSFRKTGLLGCAACYLTFREELRGVIERTQYGVRHVGRTPSENAGRKMRLLEEQERLRGEIERAVKNRNQDEAERLEGQLKELDRLIRGGEL